MTYDDCLGGGDGGAASYKWPEVHKLIITSFTRHDWSPWSYFIIWDFFTFKKNLLFGLEMLSH